MTDPRPSRRVRRTSRDTSERGINDADARARPARRRASGRAKAIGLAVGGVLLVILIILIAGGGGGVAPQVTVAGVDMGGDQAEVHAALTARSTALTAQVVTLEVGGGNFGTMRPSDLGATGDVAMAMAMASDASPTRIARGVRALTGADPITSPLPVTYRKGAVDAWVADIAAPLARAKRNAQVTVSGTNFQVTPAADGRRLNRAQLKAMVSGDLAALPSHLTLPITTTTPAFGTAAAQAQVAQAQQVIARGTQVSVKGIQVTLNPASVASAFHFGPKGLSLSGADLQKPMNRAYRATSTVPAPARFKIRGTRVSITPSKAGRLVDGKQVATGLMGEARPVQASYITTTPVFTTEKAQSLGIKEEVGSFTTPYTPGEPRVTNIHRASTILNGTIIPPNGRLSLNQVLGERTEERGFVPAPMVADGLLVDSVGGGVSQVAATLFNAAFFAGFQLNGHSAHQLYIDRYPIGREATISWPTPDLVITNDWNASALVRVWNAADSITVAIFSTSFDRRVETTTSERTNFTDPKTRLVVTDGIPAGQQQELSSGGKGFSVAVTRKVYRGAKLLSDDTSTTVYLAPPKVIGVAPGTPEAETPWAPSSH